MERGFTAIDNPSIKNCPVGKTMHINGKFNYENNAFYFCFDPEKAIRLSPSKSVESLVIVKPDGLMMDGDNFFENRELGIEGIWACDTITLEEPLDRDLLMETVLDSKDITRAGMLISYVRLTPQEREEFIEVFGEPITPYIEYFQDGNLNAFREYYDRTDAALRLKYGIKKGE